MRLFRLLLPEQAAQCREQERGKGDSKQAGHGCQVLRRPVKASHRWILAQALDHPQPQLIEEAHPHAKQEKGQGIACQKPCRQHRLTDELWPDKDAGREQLDDGSPDTGQDRAGDGQAQPHQHKDKDHAAEHPCRGGQRPLAERPTPGQDRYVDAGQAKDRDIQGKQSQQRRQFGRAEQGSQQGRSQGHEGSSRQAHPQLGLGKHRRHVAPVFRLGQELDSRGAEQICGADFDPENDGAGHGKEAVVGRPQLAGEEPRRQQAGGQDQGLGSEHLERAGCRMAPVASDLARALILRGCAFG